MGRLDNVTVEIVVHEHGTAHRSHSHGALSDIEMVQGFSYQAMSHTVTASWTVVHHGVVDGIGFGKNFVHDHSFGELFTVHRLLFTVSLLYLL